MPTKQITTIGELPGSPAVYALCGGRSRNSYVAYVGIADNLRRRIIQHLVTRDSSIATRASAVGLNPDLVTEVRWWEHEQFADRASLEAAELVACAVLEPALRSRGGIMKEAERLSSEPRFRDTMTGLFSGQPTGSLVLPSIETALARILDLERRISALEAARKR
ncbi:MAG: hypothetical protein AAB403_16370 [Planctomycetota bacterium]